MRLSPRFAVSGILAFLAVFVLAASVNASPDVTILPPVVDIGLVNNPGVAPHDIPFSLNDFYCLPDSTHHRLKTPRDVPGALDNRVNITIQNLEFDPDPMVLLNVLISNPTAFTQTYTFNITQPGVLNAPNVMSGSITLQVIDGGADGATGAAPAASAVYTALIDGAPVQTLLNDPFSLVAPSQGVNNTLASFGPQANAVPVVTDIGITLRLTLSPGDNASILSRFDVVPEPTTLALLAAGGLALLRRRR